MHIQRRVVGAIMTLHNFIRLSNLGDVDFDLNYKTGNGSTEDFDPDEEEYNDTQRCTIWKAFEISFLHFIRFKIVFILYLMFLF